MFIHIPKSGGESIEELFKIAKHHLPAFKRNNRDPSTLVFSVIRNPYDRIVSFYEHCRKRITMPSSFYAINKVTPNPKDACTQAMKKPYDEWLEYITENPSSGRLLEGYLAFEPCTEWVMTQNSTTDNNDWLQRDFLVDYVIRFEHLREDMKEFQDVLYEMGYYGKKESIEVLPQKNGSARNKTCAYYKRESTRKLIESKYESDLKVFGYPFQEGCTEL